jgi:hypothetical protein
MGMTNKKLFIMAKGTINVSVENIFPLIKKFLYSDHEIFLRELISNATDATLKLKHLSTIGEDKVVYKNPQIEIKIDKEGKKLHIIDQGVGMTKEEVGKYINEVAFSGAEEFLEKYKDSAKDSGIIGHFGLGFYSAFMVAERVEIITKSYLENEDAVKWECDEFAVHSSLFDFFSYALIDKSNKIHVFHTDTYRESKEINLESNKKLENGDCVYVFFSSKQRDKFSNSLALKIKF